MTGQAGAMALALGWVGLLGAGGSQASARGDDDERGADCRSMAANAELVLGSGSHGDRFLIHGDLPRDDGDMTVEGKEVVLQVEGRRFRVPGDAFDKSGDDAIFRGSADGADLEVELTQDGERVRFRARGTDVDLGTVHNPVFVGLRLGDRRWCDSVDADITDRRSGSGNDDGRGSWGSPDAP